MKTAVAALSLFLSIAANATESRKDQVVDPLALIDCDLGKTAMGTKGEDVGAPDVSLILTSPTDKNNTIGMIHFDDVDEFGKGAEMSIDGKQVFILSTKNPEKRILVGTTKVSLRDAQEVLPRCRIGSDNSASSRMYDLSNLNLISVELIDVKRFCTPKTWNTKGEQVKLADGEMMVTSTTPTYIAHVVGLIDITDGTTTIQIESEPSWLMEDKDFPYESKYMGFGERENCEKYVQSVKFQL